MDNLANHLWQSALVTAIAWAIAAGLRRESASVRYWVWFAASVKFLLPLQLLMALGARVDWKQPVVVIPPPVEVITVPFPALMQFSAHPVSESGVASWHLSDILALLWLAGVIVSAIRWRISWLRLHSMLRHANLLPLDLPIEVRTVTGPFEPGLFGIFKPVLVLPAGMDQRLSAEQLSLVLTHELAHLRRRDNLTATIHMVVEVLFWFFPVVWWIRRQLIAEREAACDELVLSQGSSPQLYAGTILSVCRLYAEERLLCAAGGGGSNLLRRIESIVSAPPPRPLSALKHLGLVATAAAVCAIPFATGVLNAPAAMAQSTNPPVPKFDVVSVRPCGDRPQRFRIPAESPSPGRLDVACDVLADDNHMGMIQRAYVRFAGARANPFTVIPIRGGPAWIRTEQFEIHAKTESQPAQAMILGPMLQSVLEDRFKLKIRRDTEQGPVYELTQVRRGHKVKAAKPDACVPMPAARPFPSLPSGQHFCLTRVTIASDQPQFVEAESSTASEFAKLLSLTAGRPVIDKTDLQDRFDFRVEFSNKPDGLSLFTAIQEQLGLRLVAARGPVEVLTIQHVERPSPN